MAHTQMLNALKPLLFVSVLAALTLSAPAAQDTPASTEEAFEQFWAAGSPARAQGLDNTLVDTGVTFEEAYERLSRGREYLPQATGILAMNNRTDAGIVYVVRIIRTKRPFS